MATVKRKLTTMTRLAISIAALCVTWQCTVAFVVTSPLLSTSRCATVSKLPSWTSSSFCRRSKTTSFAFVAPPPEEMEKERQKEERDDDDNDDSDDWTVVEGGFLPRINRLRQQQQQQHQRERIIEVDNLIDYKKEVVECEEEIVVVKFYSTWCRSCKAMAPLYKRLANELTYSDTKCGIKFIQVPVKPENAVLHQGLGVPSVPFGHIYHKGAGLVEEMSLNKKEFHKFKETLQHYVDGICDLKP